MLKIRDFISNDQPPKRDLFFSERDRSRIMEQIRNKRRVASRTSSNNRSTSSTQESLNRSGELESVLVDVPSVSWPVEDKKPSSKSNKEKAGC